MKTNFISSLKACALFSVLFFTSAAFAQPCVPTAGGGFFSGCSLGEDINTFILNGDLGTSIDNENTGCSGSAAYADFTALSVTLTQGNFYSVFTSSQFNNPGDNIAIWIDFNDDDIFEPSELAASVYNVMTSGINYPLYIPGTAQLGSHRMRVALNFNQDPTAMDPCHEAQHGETEDYTVVVIAGTDCSGAPAAGTTSSTNPSVCNTTSFTLSSTGYATGVGITYQWISSPAAANTFTPISGATLPFYTYTGQTAPTDYALVVTCANSSIADTTNVLSIGQNLFSNCYCNAQNNDATEGSVDSFSIAGTTLNNYTPGNNDTYVQYPATGNTTATLQQGGAYAAYIHINSGDLEPAYSAIWIDYDHSGTFDDNEYVSVGTGPLGTSSASFIVPGNALTGTTGMRVRATADFNNMSAIDACTNYYQGATQDYTITIDLGVDCSGTPDAGTTATTATTTCPANTVTLTQSGFTTGVGLSGQWISSPAGTNTFTAIAGANTTIYQITGQTEATDYAFVLTCANSGISDTSATSAIAQTPFNQCYCSDLNTDFTGGPIDSFAIGGTTLNNSTPGNTDVYDSYPATGNTTATLQQGTIYTLYINSPGDGVNDILSAVWIDYDHSGTFDVNEYISVSTGALGTSSASFQVPATAATGLTGVRVRVSPSFTSLGGFDACTNFYSGTTQDYNITIDPGVNCTGTPVAGGSLSTTSSVCSYATFTLSDTGFASGLGITYQWISSPAGANTFTAISGANGITYNVSGQTESTDYALVVTCTASGLSDTAAIVSVAENPFYLCYCNNLNTNAEQGPIDSVAISGSTLNNYTPGNLDVYDQYPAVGNTTAALQRGGSYIISVNSPGEGTQPIYSAVWIDYDQSGTFDDNEYIQLSTGALGTTSTSFIVPVTAFTGMTGMRVRVTPDYNNMGAADACTNYYDGATQDYSILIHPGINCTGVPASGNAVSSLSSVCTGSTFMVSDTDQINGIGITYQWISSPAAANTFTAISGATAITYTTTGQIAATDYALVVHCSNSNLSDTSGIVTVGQNPFYECYCSPALGTTLVTSGGHNDMTNVSIATTTLSAAIPFPNTSGYMQISAPPASNTADLSSGNTYNITATFDPFNWFVEDIGVWIDYNHDGAFDASEYTDLTNTASGTFTGSISVPVTALGGQTGMRVSANEFDFVNPGDACTTMTEGEVADFVVNILQGCAQVTDVNIFAITVSSASVQWDAITGVDGYEVVVNTSSADPAGAGSPVTFNSYPATGLTPGTTYYVHIRTDCSATSTSGWVLDSFTTTVCDTVTGLAVTALTTTAATISWTDNATIGYQYAFDQVSADPTGAGTATPLSSFGETTLTPNTTYYAHVRRDCGNGFYSDWTEISFTTHGCDTVTGLAASGISATGATISWNASTGVTGYEYVIDNSPTPPASGAATTSTSVTETSLTPNTIYYAHVRVNCGSFSGWVTIMFTTLPLGVESVNHSSFNVSAYPNPATDVVTISLSGTKGNDSKIVVTDISGKVIKTIEVKTTKTDIDMSDVAPGIYLIKYADELNTRVIKINKQ